MSSWILTQSQLPDRDVLVWTGERMAICTPLKRADGSIVFMEAHSDCLIEAPTHWMPLPEPPGGQKP
jgi:hypothetical protein